MQNLKGEKSLKSRKYAMPWSVLLPPLDELDDEFSIALLTFLIGTHSLFAEANPYPRVPGEPVPRIAAKSQVTGWKRMLKMRSREPRREAVVLSEFWVEHSRTEFDRASHFLSRSGFFPKKRRLDPPAVGLRMVVREAFKAEFTGV